MAETDSGKALSIPQLILVPALITLGVTLLRLLGELRHWPKPWFDPGSAIVGITWLAPIFGIYFALKLSRSGEVPAGLGRAIGLPSLGMVILFGGFYFVWNVLDVSFFRKLIVLWSLAALAAVLQASGWPALFKTLLTYGFAARIPVVVVMFFAMQRRWGTHYDDMGGGFASMSLVSRYLWFAVFAQLVFWVGFTIVMGSFLGSIAGAIARAARRAPPAAL